jgi:uncharacterized protein YkwD
MPVAGNSSSETKRALSRLGRLLLLSAGLFAGAAANASESSRLVTLINAYRTAPQTCDGRRVRPLGPLAMDERLALGPVTSRTHLLNALRNAGYPLDAVQTLSVSAPANPAVVMAALERRACGLLLDPRYADIGVSRRGDSWQILLARPLASTGLGGWERVGRDILGQVNQARAEPRRCGRQRFAAVPPLAWNARLAQAALAHSRDMAARNYFSHRGRDGSQAGVRAQREGYRWYGIGENIATGQATAKQAVSSWLASPGHCANIMNPVYREMGAAYAANPRSDGGIYWTQVFGKQR